VRYIFFKIFFNKMKSIISFFTYFILYFKTKLMVNLLRKGRQSRSIVSILSQELVLSHTLEGVQNKKNLKVYPNFSAHF